MVQSTVLNLPACSKPNHSPQTIFRTINGIGQFQSDKDIFHNEYCCCQICNVNTNDFLCSSKGDEDEDDVFVGPVSHEEGSVSVNMESQLKAGGSWADWRPLTGDQLEAVCEEAHRLANQLQTGELSRPHSQEDRDSNMPPAITVEGEGFVQDAQAKLSVLGETARALSPIKRQTFCVQDSPMKQLPPAVQRRLLRGNSATAASSTHPTSAATRAANTPLSTRRSVASTNSFTRQATSTRLSTSSPVAGAKSQPRTGLRGKAPLGVVLPSKPAAPATSCSTSKSKVEKTRLQPSSKVGEEFFYFLKIL